MGKELNYELLPECVPDILKEDWNVVFKNEREKEIAIKIFEWKYGPQDMFSNMSIEAWQDNKKITFTKGYFEGKISFSLNAEKISVFKIMIIIVEFIIGNQGDTEKYIGAMQSFASVFQTAINVNILKDDYCRCVYLKMIELSQNNPNKKIEISKIKQLCNDDGTCCYCDIFDCLGFSRNEHSCLVKEDLIQKAIEKLESMNVICLESNRTIAHIK